MKVAKARVRSDQLVLLATLRRIEIEKRRKEMSPKQIKLERRNRKKLQSICKMFVDDEAEETDGEDSDEGDYDKLVQSLQPLDSFGKPYLVPVNKLRKNPRLFRIASDEYDELLPIEKKIVRRQVRNYHRMRTHKF